MFGLAILSGQNQSIYVILKKRGLSLSKYLILVPAFALNILTYMNRSQCLNQISLFATDFYLDRDANTNSPEDTKKTVTYFLTALVRAFLGLLYSAG